MFYSITGTLIVLQPNLAVIQTAGGIAYTCLVSNITQNKLELSKETTLYTYLQVREDGLELFGFYNLSELNAFKMLILISGVGAKTALSILGGFTAENLALTVAADDYKTLAKIKGLGPKTAQRIILELKDKISKSEIASGVQPTAAGSSSVSEAYAALSVLGYSGADVAPIIARLDPSLSSAELIKETLKTIGNK